jgi:hypothetical protein
MLARFSIGLTSLCRVFGFEIFLGSFHSPLPAQSLFQNALVETDVQLCSNQTSFEVSEDLVASDSRLPNFFRDVVLMGEWMLDFAKALLL